MPYCRKDGKLYRYGGQHSQDGYRIRRLKRLERKTEASVQRRRTCMQEKGHPSPAFAVACHRKDVRKADIRFRATPCSRTASSGRRLSFRGRKTLWKLPCLRLPSCRRGSRKKSSVPCLFAHRKRHRERDDSSVVGFLPNRWQRPDGTFFGMADPVGDFFLL